VLLPSLLTRDSRRFWRGLASALSLLGATVPLVEAGATPAAPSQPLPAPSLGTSHVLRALHERHTSREYSPARLDAQLVADVLWAAGGVNRPATGQRTAPSAHDGRYIDLYVFDADGVSLYEPERHALRPLIAKDLRALTGIQDFAAVAPLTLLFVADERRVKGGVDDETRMLFEAVTVGAMSQNVYVLCAERGLSAGVRADIDRRPLRKALGLAGDQRILMAQSVGHPPSR
jgi:nitroreductase